MRILLIDDQLSWPTTVRAFLQKQGFEIIAERGVSEALAQLHNEKFDLLLLQASSQSLAVLKQIRRVSQIPVMALAQVIDTQQRMDLYKHSIDDYVSSQVDMAELQFRIYALLRRSRWAQPSEAPQANDEHVLSVDDLLLNRKTSLVRLADTEIELTPIQFRLLWVMASNKNKVLSKPFLYQTLFNRQYSIHDRGVDVHISRVRKKLELAGGAARRLSTVHGQGYCFS